MWGLVSHVWGCCHTWGVSHVEYVSHAGRVPCGVHKCGPNTKSLPHARCWRVATLEESDARDVVITAERRWSTQREILLATLIRDLIAHDHSAPIAKLALLSARAASRLSRHVPAGCAGAFVSGTFVSGTFVSGTFVSGTLERAA